MPSEYQQFMSMHLKKAPGSSQPEKMRHVAAMWRARKGGKGKGKGLFAAQKGAGMNSYRQRRLLHDMDTGHG